VKESAWWAVELLVVKLLVLLLLALQLLHRWPNVMRVGPCTKSETCDGWRVICDVRCVTCDV